MNVKFDRLSDVTAQVTITLEENDYRDAVKKELKAIGAKHPEKGFRAGKTPAALLEKKYGKSVKYDVINKTVSDALYDYIQKEQLRVLGNPVPERNEAFDIDAADFTFSFKLGLAPEIKSPVSKEMTVPYYTIKVTDEMIDRQDAEIRRRNGSQVEGEEVEPTAVVKGVITELNADGTPKADGIVQENGIVSIQYFKNDDQKNAFIGKKPGDVVVFNPAATCNANVAELSSMLGIDKEAAAEKTGDFSFDIKSIIVLRPAELGQELYDVVFGKDNVHDEAEYREAVRRMIEDSLRADSDYRFSVDAREAVMKAAGEIDLPSDILKDFLRMQKEEMSEEQAEVEYAKAEPELKWDLMRDAIAQQLDIKIEESDLREIARTLARRQFAQYGMTNVPDDVVDRYADDILKDRKYREQLAQQALDMKLFNGIRASVTLEPKEVSVEEFNALFAPAQA